jgi:hypothetical protein
MDTRACTESGITEMTEQGIICAEKPQQCDKCGNIDELRPYGPNGSMVCFTCGMEDEEEMKRQFRKLQGWETT